MRDSVYFWDDPDEPPARKPAQMINYKFPLRPDFMAQVILPIDLTTKEVDRIRALLMTLPLPEK